LRKEEYAQEVSLKIKYSLKFAGPMALAKLFVDFTTYVSTLKSQHDDELRMLSDMQNRLGDLSKTFQNNLTSWLFKWKRIMTKEGKIYFGGSYNIKSFSQK
jgi:hypothetical protein